MYGRGSEIDSCTLTLKSVLLVGVHGRSVGGKMACRAQMIGELICMYMRDEWRWVRH